MIGVFDSGVGGLSVLRAMKSLRTDVPLMYLADSAHAPYGERDARFVLDRSERLTRLLMSRGAKRIVIACNTATAWAVDALRDRFPGTLFVGVEPGIKPAVALSRTGHVAVLATPGTLASPRFAALVARHSPDTQVTGIACAGLAAEIERGAWDSSELANLLDRYCEPLNGTAVDTLVLGCTHYPFVAGDIARRVGPGVSLLDTSDAVARQALSNWPSGGGTGDRAPITLMSTGDESVLRRLARIGLDVDQPVEQVSC